MTLHKWEDSNTSEFIAACPACRSSGRLSVYPDSPLGCTCPVCAGRGSVHVKLAAEFYSSPKELSGGHGDFSMGAIFKEKVVTSQDQRIKTLEQLLIDIWMSPCTATYHMGAIAAELKELLTELGYLTPMGNLTPEGIARRDEE